MTSSVLLPPARPECRPQVRLHKSGNSLRTKSLSAICGGISPNIRTYSRDNTPETIFTPRSLHSRRRPLGSLEADRALQVRAPSSHREESRAQIRLFNHRVRGSDHARTGSDSE